MEDKDKIQVNKDYAVKPFTIVKHAGIPVKATTLHGKTVYRAEKIWIEELRRFVVAAPYDNHFIYLLPKGIPGWFAMCTCGGAAVLVGSNVYAQDASPSKSEGAVPGEMLVCMLHATNGHHASGDT